MIKSHWELTNTAFVNQFESCSLEESLFTHEAHLRLAWIYLDSYELQEAIGLVRTGLKKYVSSLGANEKYNETVTVAAVNAVNHFKKRTKASNFEHFIAETPRLKYHFKQLLESHYSTDIFTSEEARRYFLLPDKLPFN